jgi:peptidyl-prolyl cis-trans isomerase C
MVPPFERAALALEPGNVAPEVVESDYGYHIIKLEKKDKDPADPKLETYDVRHILISTSVKDPDSPLGSEKPVKLFVRQKLEDEKEKRVIEDIVASNNILVPTDFVIPSTSSQSRTTTKKRRPVSRKRPVRK